MSFVILHHNFWVKPRTDLIYMAAYYIEMKKQTREKLK